MKVSALNQNIYSNFNVTCSNYQIQAKPIGQLSSDLPACNQANLIYFTSNKSRNTSPFLKKTIDSLDRTYDKYYQSQVVTEKEDIRSTVKEIMAETGESEEYVLEAMGHVTQFANFRSIKKIGDALNSERVNDMTGGADVISSYYPDYFFVMTYDEKTEMLATTFKYLFNKKELYSFDKNCNSENRAVFLDDDQMNCLEKLNRERSQDVKTFADDNKVKFFIISGFENGVTFANRNKDLKSATKDLIEKAKENDLTLEDAVDFDLIERAKRLGLNPIVIKNKPDFTIEGIYENMKPELINRVDLINIVDVNSEMRLEATKDERLLEAKDETADYLERKLEVFSPERMSESLSVLHDKIVDYAQSKGKTEDDIYYYVPEEIKSYKIINYMYKKVNGIPIEKFVKDIDLDIRKSHFKEGDILVTLDDCTISGESFFKLERDLRECPHSKLYDRVYACIYGTQKAKDVVENARKRPLFLAVEENEKNENVDVLDLRYVIGDSGYEDDASCCVFPYMAPDNNSGLARSIELLHNITYRTDEDSDIHKGLHISTLVANEVLENPNRKHKIIDGKSWFSKIFT